MPGSQPLILTTLGSATVVGLVLALLRTVPPALGCRLGREEARVGGLGWVFTLTLVPMMLVGGLLLDKWGAQDVLILGSLGVALGIASFGLSTNYRAALGAAAVLGGGFALVHTSTAVLMPSAFAPDRPATATNLGYLVIGLSALGLGGLTALLHRKLGLRSSLLLLGLLSLVPAFVAVLTPVIDFPGPVLTGDFRTVLHDSRVWWAGMILLLYYPLEQSVHSWAPAYLAEVGCRPARVPVVMGIFWIAFVGSRLGAAFLPPGSEPWLILALVLAAAATLGNMIGVYQRQNGRMGLWLLALCLGPVLPTLVGGLLRAFPTQPGTALGAAFALGSCGSLVLGPAVDSYARSQPARPTMRAVLLLPLILAAPALVLCLVLSGR